MNHVNLIGKVSSAPRVIELNNGKKIAQFTMSTKELYLNEKGETKTRSNWHKLVAWGRWVNVLEELGTVGMDLAIEGKLVTRFYHEQNKRKSSTEVEINDLIIL